MKVPVWITHLKKPGSLWGAVIGWACICAGLLGLVLPVIPGIALLAAGLFILSARYRWASYCLKWLQRQARKVSAGRSRQDKDKTSSLVTTDRG
jgi:uncharacterized membrane protein YbaN (DUF454 family)